VIFWSKDAPDFSPIHISRPVRCSLYACLLGMLFLGIYPSPIVTLATQAVRVLK